MVGKLGVGLVEVLRTFRSLEIFKVWIIVVGFGIREGICQIGFGIYLDEMKIFIKFS